LRPSCLVDTTFVPTRTPYLCPYFYYNVNKHSYGLLYQVAVGLSFPVRIVDFSGPFKGSCSDVSIFRSTLLPLLRERELVMCDKGYLAEKRCWTPPKGKFQTLTREQKGKSIEVTKIRQVNERAIERLKEYGIMTKKWTLDFEFHGLCARCVAKLTQLQLFTNPLT
jgi:hypothetical protein